MKTMSWVWLERNICQISYPDDGRILFFNGNREILAQFLKVNLMVSTEAKNLNYLMKNIKKTQVICQY